MRDVTDPAVIPALESTVWSDLAKASAKRDAASAFQREGVAWLGRLSVQRATYSLTQLSVLGKQADLRGAAANELRSRNLHDFVPILLDGLANPVQFDYSITLDAEGMASYSAVLSREGRDADRQVRFADSFWSNVVFNFWASGLKITMLEARHYENGLFADEVARRNRPTKQLDDRISLVMECVTGEHPACPTIPAGDSDVIPDSAVASSATSTADYWWNWWDKYNEMYTPYKPSEEVNTSIPRTYCRRIRPPWSRSDPAEGTDAHGAWYSFMLLLPRRYAGSDSCRSYGDREDSDRRSCARSRCRYG